MVALADKLETLVGLFGIGQVPTGDKDPFALRRHALGVIRMLVERDLPLRRLDRLRCASCRSTCASDAACIGDRARRLLRRSSTTGSAG